MKKKIIVVLVMLTVARLADAQVTFGFTAGATFASYRIKSGDVALTSKMRAGFTAGFQLSCPIGKSVWFLPGLNFTQKGGVLENGADNTTQRANYGYLEVPLNIVYHTNSDKGKFFIGGGPSFGYGLFGKYKITGMFEENGDIKFGYSDDDDLKPLELGANVLAGYQFTSGFLIAANFDLGINNVSAPGDATFHNRYFGIRVGYMLVKK